jgi:hypothetical protein
MSFMVSFLELKRHARLIQNSFHPIECVIHHPKKTELILIASDLHILV